MTMQEEGDGTADNDVVVITNATVTATGDQKSVQMGDGVGVFAECNRKNNSSSRSNCPHGGARRDSSDDDDDINFFINDDNNKTSEEELDDHGIQERNRSPSPPPRYVTACKQQCQK